MKLAVAAASLALGVGGFTVTALPRPAFPAPVAKAPAAKRLVLLSSREVPAWAEFCTLGGLPRAFRGAALGHTFCPGGTVFALYGRRYLMAFGRNGFLYGFDFKNYVWPPRIASGEREFVYEEIVWAREAGGVLYVETAHYTYARSSYGLNGYVTAIDLRSRKLIWRTPALVANVRTFVLAGEYLVTGYGFTAEPDDLYLIDRRTGRVLERLKLPSAPERIVRRDDRIFVRTYDHDVVVELRRP